MFTWIKKVFNSLSNFLSVVGRSNLIKLQKGIQFWFSILVISHIEPSGSLYQPHLLEKLLQLGSDGVTDLGGGGLATNVTSASASLDNIADSLLDDASLIEHAEGVLHHHSNGENSGNGVNNALSSNIGSRACMRFSKEGSLRYTGVFHDLPWIGS